MPDAPSTNPDAIGSLALAGHRTPDRSGAGAEGLIDLQQAAGNRAVAGLLARRADNPAGGRVLQGGGGGGPGKVRMRELFLTKRVDKLSPELRQASNSGGSVGALELFVSSSNKRLVFRFKDVLIKHVQSGESAEGEIETLELDFAEYEPPPG